MDKDTPSAAGCFLALLPPRALRTGTRAAFAAALFAGQIAKGQEEIWTGPSNSLWSVGSNWLDGTAPPLGGDPALTLRFQSGGIFINDLGEFRLNRMVFDSNSAGPTTISSTSGSLRFTGANSVVMLQGIGDVTISSPILLDGADHNLTISGAGPGNLTLSGDMAGASPDQTLTIDTGNTSPNISQVRLAAKVSTIAGVILKSGNLVVASNKALGVGPLNVYGGTITLGYGVTVSNPISLHGDLTLRTSPVGSFTGVISSATPGAGLIIGSSMTLSSASTYTGPTTVEYNNAHSGKDSRAILYLDGPEGSLLHTSEFNVRSGSTLELRALGPTGNRIADTTPIHLRGGELHLSGSVYGVGPIGVETVGPVDGAGYSSVTASGGELPVRLNLTSLSRTERGTFLFRGDQLADQLASVGNIYVNTPPDLVGGGGTGPKTSIIPYAIGDTYSFGGSGPGLVTYSPTHGVRILDNATEYRSALAFAASDENVRLNELVETLNTPQTVNALYLDHASIKGTGTLTIASGALFSNYGEEITSPLAFGSVEANIFTLDQLFLRGTISGTNGLTKSGPGALILAASNSFTGPLTINSGSVVFTEASQLGLDTSPIVINGSGGGIAYNGSNVLELSRPIETRTGLAKIAGNLNITTPISGTGGLRLSTPPNRFITLPSDSTYAGATKLESAEVKIPNDSALGVGGALDLDGGTIVLTGAWNSGREINIKTGTLDTAGYDAVWSGPLTSVGATNNLGTLTKRGAGELRLTAPSRFRGSIVINSGTFTLANAGRLAADATVNVGGELRLDHGAPTGATKLGETSKVYLNGGKLSVIGNATTAITENLQRLIPIEGGRSDQTLDLITPGAADLRLIIREEISPGGALLIRAAELGGQQRVVLSSATGLEDGILRSIYASSLLASAAESFAVYDSATNAGGVIGIRPLKPSEYTLGPIIGNPANGGSTPVDAFALADSAVTATGAANTIDNLTLASGGSVSLTAGQTLAITSGHVLARSGASTISGGTLSFAAPANIYAAGDLTIGSAVVGAGGIRKLGPGTLLLSNPMGYSGGTEIADGVLRLGNGVQLNAQTLTIHRPGILNAGMNSISAGSLAGTGTVILNGGTLTVGGLGTSFTFSGALTGTGQVVIEDGGEPTALRTFNGSSTFAGDVVLNSGQLQLSSADALGTGALIINGGALQGEINTRIAPKFVLNADLLVFGRLNLVSGVSILGSKDLVLQKGAFLELSGDLDLPGRVRTHLGLDIAYGTGGISIRGAEGSITTPAGVQLGNGGVFFVDDRVTYLGGAKGRLGDTTPVHMAGGRFDYFGNPSSNSTEKFGSLTGAGFSSVEIFSSESTSASLTAASISRVDRGTFWFRGVYGPLGVPAGPTVGQVYFETAPVLVGGGGEGANTSIIPWALASSGETTGLATYGTNGVRKLEESEYVTNLTSASSVNNVKLAASASLDAPQTINSLTLDAVTLSGSSTLTITSGTILSAASSGTAQITANLDFGSAEAQFFLPTADSAPLTVSGNISGSGGLTRSGYGTLTLMRANTFTGPVTINGGTLAFSTLAALGQGNAAITMYSNGERTAALDYGGAGNVTLSRDIFLGGGVAEITASGTGSLQISGEISGPGRLHIGGPSLVTLSDANSYEGSTSIYGNVAISSDASLGLDGSVYMGIDSKLGLKGNWTTSRPIEIESATIDTAEFDANLQGALSIRGALTKIGSGRMIINRVGSYSGRLAVNDGVVELRDFLPGDITSDPRSTVVLGSSIGGRLDVSGILDIGPGVQLVTADTLLLKANSSLRLRLDSATSHDQITSVKRPSLEGPISLDLELLSGWDPTDHVDEFVLINNRSDSPIEMTSASPFRYAGNPLAERERFTAGGQEWELSYQGGSGNNDVVLYAVPEPATGVALVGGLALLGLRRRRSSKH